MLKELERIHKSPKLKEAAIEYARLESIKRSEEREPIRSSIQSAQKLIPYFENLEIEMFYVMFLNRANKVISIEKISEGGYCGTVVDVRVIFRKALENKACAIILSHNHPSGNTKPSGADQEITKRIVKAGEIMDIRVLDHIIVSGNNYYSLADEGEM